MPYIIIAWIIAKISDEMGIISENTPSSIAVGCLFFVLNYYKVSRITKKYLSEVCKISEVTICKTNKKLKENYKYFEPIFTKYVQKYIDMNDKNK